MSKLRAVVVIILIALMSLVLMPIQIVAIALGIRPVMRALPMIWNRIAVRLLGLRIRIHGKPADERPLLVLSNHVSWLDISVICSLMPLSFISKAEVADWPFFGWCAKLSRSVFVTRERRGATGDKASEIGERLKAGDVMVLFAEGTSSNGIHVRPFRTALLGAANGALTTPGARVLIQPLAIAYTGLYGLPLGRFRKPHVAWYGDMDMAPHLWSVLKRAEIDVDVMWLEPIVYTAGSDRKAIARQAEAAVREALGRATAGRIEEAAPAATAA